MDSLELTDKLKKSTVIPALSQNLRPIKSKSF
jgi:hypothetical protein